MFYSQLMGSNSVSSLLGQQHLQNAYLSNHLLELCVLKHASCDPQHYHQSFLKKTQKKLVYQ